MDLTSKLSYESDYGSIKASIDSLKSYWKGSIAPVLSTIIINGEALGKDVYDLDITGYGNDSVDFNSNDLPRAASLVNEDIIKTNELIDEISTKIISNENAIMEKRTRVLSNYEKMEETVTVFDYDSNGKVIGSHEEPKYDNAMLAKDNEYLEEQINSLKEDNAILGQEVAYFQETLRQKDDLMNQIKIDINTYDGVSFNLQQLYDDEIPEYIKDDNNNIVASKEMLYNDQNQCIGYKISKLDKEKVLSITAYNNKGQVLSETINRYNDGKLIGRKFREYDFNGYLKTTTLVDELGNNISKTDFYRDNDGNITYSEKYGSNGKLLQVDMYNNGNLYSSSNYDSDGFLTFESMYNEKGRREIEKIYNHGEISKVVYYDEEGNIINKVDG